MAWRTNPQGQGGIAMLGLLTIGLTGTAISCLVALVVVPVVLFYSFLLIKYC